MMSFLKFKDSSESYSVSFENDDLIDQAVQIFNKLKIAQIRSLENTALQKIAKDITETKQRKLQLEQQRQREDKQRAEQNDASRSSKRESSELSEKQDNTNDTPHKSPRNGQTEDPSKHEHTDQPEKSPRNGTHSRRVKKKKKSTKTSTESG
jgi:hypothetical protein